MWAIILGPRLALIFKGLRLRDGRLGDSVGPRLALIFKGLRLVPHNAEGYKGDDVLDLP